MGSVVSKRLEEVERTGTMDLRGCGLSAVPGQLYSARKMVKLLLGWNSLRALPVEFARLGPSLLALYANHNSMEAFPASVLSLTGLMRLYLNNNKIPTLPTQLCDLKDLRVLAMSCNELRSLPAEVGRLHRLQELYLSENHLSTIPESVGTLMELRVLALVRNDLTSLPFAALARLPKLTTLSLDGNPGLTSLTEAIAAGPLAVLTAIAAVVHGGRSDVCDSSTDLWRRSATEADLVNLFDSSSASELTHNAGHAKVTLSEIMEAARALPGKDVGLAIEHDLDRSDTSLRLAEHRVALETGAALYRHESKLMDTEAVLGSMRRLLQDTMDENTKLQASIADRKRERLERANTHADAQRTLEKRIKAARTKAEALTEAITAKRQSIAPIHDPLPAPTDAPRIRVSTPAKPSASARNAHLNRLSEPLAQSQLRDSAVVCAVERVNARY